MGKIQHGGIRDGPGTSAICQCTEDPLRQLHDAGTGSILGCPLLLIMEHRRIWKHIFQRRPLFSYLLPLLEPSSPGQGVSTSSRKVITERSRLQYPSSSVVLHSLGIGKWFAFSLSWEVAVPMPLILSPWLWSSNAPLCTYSGAERLTGWQPQGIPGQGCRGHNLEIGMDLFNEVTELLTRN